MSAIAVIDPSRIQKPTPQHVLLEQIAAGAAGLASKVTARPPFLPTTADLHEATRAAEGLVRLLGQLAVSEVPPDAA